MSNENEGYARGPWSKSEDAKLRQLVDIHQPRNWTTLATQLGTRSGKQCRERWLNHLDPDINKGPWTKEEDELLMRLHHEMGNRWSDIARLMPRRTDNALKNRFNSRLKKLYGDGSATTPAERTKSPASSKFGSALIPSETHRLDNAELKKVKRHPLVETPKMELGAALRPPAALFQSCDGEIELATSPAASKEPLTGSKPGSVRETGFPQPPDTTRNAPSRKRKRREVANTPDLGETTSRDLGAPLKKTSEIAFPLFYPTLDKVDNTLHVASTNQNQLRNEDDVSSGQNVSLIPEQGAGVHLGVSPLDCTGEAAPAGLTRIPSLSKSVLILESSPEESENVESIKRPKTEDRTGLAAPFDVADCYQSDPACVKLVNDFGTSFAGDDGGPVEDAEIASFNSLQPSSPPFLSSVNSVPPRSLFPP